MGRRSRQKQLRRQGSSQPDLPTTLSNRPQKTATAAVPAAVARLQITSETSLHAGPLPDPDTLARYGQIMPDLPARIVEMAERQSLHRQKIENRESWSEVIQRVGGLLGAIGICTLFGFLAYRLVENGREVQGFVAALTTLGALISALLASVAARRSTGRDQGPQRQQ